MPAAMPMSATERKPAHDDQVDNDQLATMLTTAHDDDDGDDGDDDDDDAGDGDDDEQRNYNNITARARAWARKF